MQPIQENRLGKEHQRRNRHEARVPDCGPEGQSRFCRYLTKNGQVLLPLAELIETSHRHG